MESLGCILLVLTGLHITSARRYSITVKAKPSALLVSQLHRYRRALRCTDAHCKTALHLRIDPPNGAFIIKHAHQPPPSSHETLSVAAGLVPVSTEQRPSEDHHEPASDQHQGIQLFLPDDCPISVQQSLVASHAGVRKRVPLMSLYADSTTHPHCGITARLVQPNVRVKQTQPYIDVVVSGDASFLPSNGNPLCATVSAMQHDSQLLNHCHISIHQPFCVIRLILPLEWWRSDPDFDQDRLRPGPDSSDSDSLHYDHVQLGYRMTVGRCKHSDLVTVNTVTRIDRRTLALLRSIEPKSQVGLEPNNFADFERIVIDRESGTTAADPSWTVSLFRPKQELIDGTVFTTHLHLEYNADEADPLYLITFRCLPIRGVKILSIHNRTDSGWTTVYHRHPNNQFTFTVFYTKPMHMSLNESWSGVIASLVLQADLSFQNNDIEIPRVPDLDKNITYEIDTNATQTTINSSSGIEQRSTSSTASISNVEEQQSTACLEWAVRYVVGSSSVTPEYGTTTGSEKLIQDKTEPEEETAVSKIDREIENMLLLTTETRTRPPEHSSVTEMKIEPDRTVAIVPMLTTSQLINTAALSGQQVSYTMKVFSVSSNSQIKDVTFGRTKCTSANDSVLKVSSACTNVYMDGSEITGAREARIFVNYTDKAQIDRKFVAMFSIRVWYPELPVSIWLSDPVLNSIRDWRLPTRSKLDFANYYLRKRYKRAAVQLACTTRYQEAEVRVFAQFTLGAENDDTSNGAKTVQKLGGNLNNWQFDVTSLVIDHVTIVKPKIAKITATKDRVLILRGHQPGTTTVQVQAPLTKKVMGAANVDVVDESVSAMKMSALVTVDVDVSFALSSIPQQIRANIRHRRMFTNQFQPGWGTITIEYSDGQHIPLEWLKPDEYVLTVWPIDKDKLILEGDDKTGVQDTGVVHIMVITDNGWGAEIQFQLRAPDGCENPNGTPLLETTARVEAVFHHQNEIPLPNDLIPFYNPAETATRQTAILLNDATVKYQSPDKRNSMNGMPTTSLTTGGRELTTFEICLLILLAFMLVFGGIMAVNYWLVTTGRQTLPLHHRGYKFHKLVPLPALRFFGRRRATGEQSADEWVWLSRDQIEASNGGSMTSKYSRRSTMEVEHNRMVHSGMMDPHMDPMFHYTRPHAFTMSSARSRSTGNTTVSTEQQSVSYRGSEISIFLSQHPTMQVHECHPMSRSGIYGDYGMSTTPGTARRAVSWTKPRSNKVRITSNPMVDSSSEQNLSTLGVTSPTCLDNYGVMARSAGQMEWSDAASVTFDDSELREYFGALRESVA